MSICPIEKLIQFDLLDDCIHTPAGYYHFYRYYPPNTDIMTEEEKKAEIEQMTQLFDTLAREIAIFATDKIEDMSEIKRFYKNLAPEYDHLTSDIIAAIESTESRNSAAVQRAFCALTHPGPAAYNGTNCTKRGDGNGHTFQKQTGSGPLCAAG